MSDFRTFLNAVKNGNIKDVVNSFQPEFLERVVNDKHWKRRPIHFACWNGHLEVVKFLLENKCSLECEDHLKRQPIHSACLNGHLEVVKFLFLNKCSLEYEDKDKRQLIHFACWNGHLEIVKFLLQNNCSLECEDHLGQRPIHLACRNGNLEVVKFLFQNKCSLECEDKEKMQPIHLACLGGNLEVVRFLFQNECSLECEDEYKRRPIHLACYYDHLEVVKFLIQSNCEVDCRTKGGETPIDLAWKKRNKSCAKVVNEHIQLRKNDKAPMKMSRFRTHESLNETTEQHRKIFDSVIRNDAQAFGALYSPTILMMEQHETGFSLLEIALESNANDIIDYILNKSVNAEELSALENYLNNSYRRNAVELIQECLLYRSIRFHEVDGFHLSCLSKTINEHRKLVKMSFLEMAAEHGCKAFIHVILKKSVYNDEEWTNAEKLAISNGHVEISEAISARKRILRKRADKCFTWLHSAVCDNDPDMMKYILEKDLVNPNSNNEVVGTALALAHMMCYEECIKVLEKFNVDVNTQNKYSQSPLHEAIGSGMIDQCSYLIRYTNDIDRPGFMGFTSLQCAVTKGCEKLCEELLKNGADCVRFVKIFQQSAFSKKVLPISRQENAVSLCAKIHRKIYPCFLQALDSDKFKCSEVQSVMTSEIFHLAIPDGDPKIILSLFAKSSPTVQQVVIENLLDHFAATDNYNDFVHLLTTEIAEPKLFPNGETLLTNLLMQKKFKYCSAIINCESNTKCLLSPNFFNKTPLQITIESDLFDLMTPLILNCEDETDLGFDWNIPLLPLFQKLSMSNNNDADEKLLAAIKAIILRGGNIYKKTPEGFAIINYCTRFNEGIAKFQKSVKPKAFYENNSRPKERDDKNICSICLDREVNCVLDCGHTFCMDCGIQLNRCAICNSEVTKPKKLYFN